MSVKDFFDITEEYIENKLGVRGACFFGAFVGIILCIGVLVLIKWLSK